MKQGDSHLHHGGLVPLQDLDGLRGFGIDDEDTGVTSLSYQPLPAPGEQIDRRTGDSMEIQDSRIQFIPYIQDVHCTVMGKG